MTKQPIPVVPAQHYTCGGIVIERSGRTDLPGLYAAGECTESGLHGANRLASNSLLECFVFGEAAGCRHPRSLGRVRRAAAGARVGREPGSPIPTRKSSSSRTGPRSGGSCGTTSASCALTKRLERAAHRIKLLTDEVNDFYGHFRVGTDLIELRNLLQCAELIVRSALKRHESRGLHYTLDFSQHARPGKRYGAGAMTTKTALVTGASQGIGAATAKVLAADGYRVIVHYGASRDKALDVVAAIRAAGGLAETVQADLADPAAPQALAEEVKAICGGALDALVLNAAVMPASDISDCSPETFDRIVTINLRAPFFLLQNLARRWSTAPAWCSSRR